MANEALLTNQAIHKSRSTLELLHYPLISAYKHDEHRFHVAVQPSRLNECLRNRPHGFALIFYKSKLLTTTAFVVIPFARVQAMFTPERRDAKDGGWNAYVTVESRFRTSADRAGEIDVANCRGDRPLPQRILALSLTPNSGAELEAALRELERG